MAVLAISARYGHGTYGLAEYGVVDISQQVGGVEATGIVPGVEVKPTEAIDNVVATGFLGTLSIRVSEIISLSGVSSTVFAGTFTISNSGNATGVSGTGVAGQTTESATSFNFESVKDLYDRRRTVLVPKKINSQRTVYA